VSGLKYEYVTNLEVTGLALGMKAWARRRRAMRLKARPAGENASVVSVFCHLGARREKQGYYFGTECFQNVKRDTDGWNCELGRQWWGSRPEVAAPKASSSKCRDALKA